MVWLLPSPEVTTQPSTPPLSTNDNHHHMPRRRNQKAERYDSHEEKVAKAIKELKENPKSRPKHVAAYQ
jgi:hypothetical protein